MWLALIGLFLSGAARATRMETNVMEGLEDVRVADVMSRDCATVAAATFLSDVAEQVRRTGRRCFFVSDGERVAGMVTTKELRAVPRDKWMVTSASTAMRPVEGLRQIDADAPVTQAIEVIGREDAGQVPVFDHGQIRGVISREQIQRLLTARAELAA
jgi:CBS domain-containing protein